MKKAIAIPARLLKPDELLTVEERAELALLGEQDMDANEIYERQLDEAAAEAQMVLDDRADRIAHLAQVRSDAVDAGFDFGGVRILCDIKSTTYLTAARLEAMADPEYSVNWKTPDGFVVLSAAVIIAATTTARQFVQKCFDVEAELLPEVEDDTLFTKAAIETAFNIHMED